MKTYTFNVYVAQARYGDEILPDFTETYTINANSLEHAGQVICEMRNNTPFGRERQEVCQIRNIKEVVI
ncbi:MAG: hypothetical protein K0Q79_115 [Flavipsychrobacter sp.]|jgi:hypothetical protein|nr:hypothetical protein [Flavipsychrobacter sp.]